MSGSPRIIVSYFLMLQFSLFSSVDVWAMTMPTEMPSQVRMAREVRGMDMEHCQTEKKKQCRCAGCACVPLVIGMVVEPVLQSAIFDSLFPDPDPSFYQIPLVPPFRPPIS